MDKSKNKCGCACIDANGNGTCETMCGIEYSNLDQAAACPIPSPQEWPPLLQLPAPEYRAVRTDFIPFTDLPDELCRSTGSCPVTILLTGVNQSFGESMLLSHCSLSPFFLICSSDPNGNQILIFIISFIHPIGLGQSFFTGSFPTNSTGILNDLANFLLVGFLLFPSFILSLS